ncbi:MAG: hypothetical protein V3V39_12890 [Desulfobacterales bacterium]
MAIQVIIPNSIENIQSTDNKQRTTDAVKLLLKKEYLLLPKLSGFLLDLHRSLAP